ncbi:MAG: glycerol-3-phosphate 1-O-acyltransferase PlsY [Lentimicrobiaceae bacterium]|jgi:glycerol-3-phosphate acyltransferase PlsY|nr:glycerol-3-phosphate 1-O-acyltransferase PlsY [Lentimicrobiaceae bacterium]MBT3455041.1 glycerol-3-phosphate 1-O-acyltransferase PlsY [Lentimicrobiaceae bacterium]MBT3818979.1 glycerol-3-phosphate 1-O-acyltransferase PlsY [Lentimicrobiaceae bacterium]MBT4062004.1 glycerol-3-phosphate 1-O-acyltransferase PlsY [Lentimicrobiaceae bacterium]MBT4189955.1 glycerol-3-phosphate 1-O-acyltransferase PlsY [Lentimicrobiaceae bacterium]
MSLWGEILFIIASYLLGAIPFGYIFTKQATGKNIRNHGSGNIGSTNVKRIAGKKVSIQTQVFDILKGFLPVSTVIVLEHYNIYNFPEFMPYAVGIASIVGHDYSVFLKFNGGKGVNTTIGASVIFAPIQIFVGIMSYYLVKHLSKYVSLGSLVLILVITLLDAILNGFGIQFYYFVGCTLLIYIRHFENIKRLLAGTETKTN